MLDRVTVVDRVAKAIERVFTSDGWINDEIVYLPEDIKKIGESLARRAGDPSRFVCQGFHTSSVIQSKMRQLLETDPQDVIEPIADLVTRGVAQIGHHSNKIEVRVDLNSMELDLEARLCDEQSILAKGYRDAAGQLYDLMVMQAFLGLQHSDENSSFSFRQRPSPGCQTTGEATVKHFKGISGRQDMVREGCALTVKDAILLSKFLEGRSDGVIFHSSVLSDFEHLPVLSAENLVERVNYYFSQTKRPAQILVYANRLLGLNQPETGHDLHMISAIYDAGSELFFCQSHWGQLFDKNLNGIEAKHLFESMEFRARAGKDLEEYDQLSPDERYIDTVFPVKPRDWSQPMLELKKEVTRLELLESKAFASEKGIKIRKYRENLKEWIAMRKEHIQVFGDSIAFDKPKPERPV